jgi:hypothetical protein
MERSEHYIKGANIRLHHARKDGTGNGKGHYRGEIQYGPEKNAGKYFPIDNIGDDDPKKSLREYGKNQEDEYIPKNLEHGWIFNKQLIIFNTDKDFISTHTVPFKSAVIKIKKQWPDTENGEKEHNWKDKKITFVLIVNFVSRAFFVQRSISRLLIRGIFQIPRNVKSQLPLFGFGRRFDDLRRLLGGRFADSDSL